MFKSKKFLAALMTLVMLISVTPLSVFAAPSTPPTITLNPMYGYWNGDETQTENKELLANVTDSNGWKLNASDVPPIENYPREFYGWVTTPGNAQKVNLETATFDTDTTLYAQWLKSVSGEAGFYDSIPSNLRVGDTFQLEFANFGFAETDIELDYYCLASTYDPNGNAPEVSVDEVASVTKDGLVTILGTGTTQLVAVTKANHIYSASVIKHPLDVATPITPSANGEVTLSLPASFAELATATEIMIGSNTYSLVPYPSANDIQRLDIMDGSNKIGKIEPVLLNTRATQQADYSTLTLYGSFVDSLAQEVGANTVVVAEIKGILSANGYRDITAYLITPYTYSVLHNADVSSPAPDPATHYIYLGEEQSIDVSNLELAKTHRFVDWRITASRTAGTAASLDTAFAATYLNLTSAMPGYDAMNSPHITFDVNNLDSINNWIPDFSDNITFTAVWEELVFEDYSVVNKGTGTNGNFSEPVGTTIQLNAGTREGHVFNGWSTNNNTTFTSTDPNYSAHPEFDPNASFVLLDSPNVTTVITAVWHELQEYPYTVMDDYNGNVRTRDNYTVLEGNTTVVNALDGARNNYEFTHWSVEPAEFANAVPDLTATTLVLQSGSFMDFPNGVTLTAHWEYVGTTPEPVPDEDEDVDTYDIDIIVVGNGSVSPDGGYDSSLIVDEGDSKTFSIRPDVGQSIQQIYIDGKLISTVSEYTFNNVRDDHVIKVVFSTAHTNPSTGIR